MTPRSRLGAVIALLALVAVPAACSRSAPQEDAAALQPVTLMLNWTPNNHHAGIYAALGRGWYEEEGIALSIVEPGDTQVEQVVGAGRAAFGLAQAESLLPAREQGVPVVSIATVLPSNDSALMALGTEGISRPRDLQGKTYGGFGGPLETELIRRLVTCDGGDPDTVAFVEVGDVDYLGGLNQDRFDFAWVFNGWDVVAARDVAGADIATIPFAEHLDCIPDWYTPIVITGERTASEDPELVRAFLAATRRGYELADREPEEAARLLLAAVDLDPELVEASAAYHAGRYVAGGRPWGTQDPQVWQRFAEFLAEAGLTGETVDAARAFTDEYLPEP